LELLPQLRLEPKDMILTRRLACEESPHDRRLDFQSGSAVAIELLLDAFHDAPLPVNALRAACFGSPLFAARSCSNATVTPN
jgi:hypothetical protein